MDAEGVRCHGLEDRARRPLDPAVAWIRPAHPVPGLPLRRAALVTLLEVYFDFMRSFHMELRSLSEEGLISTIEIGLGASGELRYPSCPEKMGWRYPGLGEFQVIVHTWGRQALATQTWTGLAPAAQVKRQRSPMHRRRRFHFPCRGTICVSYRYTGSSATYSTRPRRAGSRPTCRDSRTWMASPSRRMGGDVQNDKGSAFDLDTK